MFSHTLPSSIQFHCQTGTHIAVILPTNIQSVKRIKLLNKNRKNEITKRLNYGIYEICVTVIDTPDT